jgi:hypothetical protein
MKRIWLVQDGGYVAENRTSENLPPITGIARKQRSDKGVPRTSSMDEFYARFRGLDAGQQKTSLEVLRQLHLAKADAEINDIPQ